MTSGQIWASISDNIVTLLEVSPDKNENVKNFKNGWSSNYGQNSEDWSNMERMSCQSTVQLS